MHKAEDFKSSGSDQFPHTRKLNLVPRTGLEPACLSAEDFKSPVYSIPPSGRIFYLSHIFLKNLLNRCDQLFVLLCVNYNTVLPI